MVTGGAGRRRPGRPVVEREAKTTVPIYMSADVAERLRVIAEGRGLSRNSLVGKILAEFVRTTGGEPRADVRASADGQGAGNGPHEA